MGDSELMNRPCLKDFVYSSSKFPKTILKTKELPSDLNWQNHREEIENALQLTPFLYTDDCENYCKGPFDKDNCDKLLNKLQVSSVLNETGDVVVSLKPPFVISYKTMSIDAGKGENQRATAEMVNKWYLLPKFIHLLIANKRNQSIKDASKEPVIARLALYAIRHHVHNYGFSNIRGHGCMFVYDLPYTPLLVNDKTEVILVALYLTEIVNAALTTIHDDDKQDISEGELLTIRRNKLLKETRDISLLFSTMNHYANNPGNDRMINELGKIYIL